MTHFQTFLVALTATIATTPNLLSQQGPPFQFEDATVNYQLRDQFAQPEDGRYEAKIFDGHVLGACLVDLDGDRFPELVLPGPRTGGQGSVPNQDEGGVYVLPNIPAAGGGRAFDWNGKQIYLTSPNNPGAGTEVSGILPLDYDDDGDLDLLVVCAGETSTTALVNPPFPTVQNRLLRNDFIPNGTLGFTPLLPGTTDPDPNSPVDGHGLAYTEEPNALARRGTVVPWQYDPDWTDTLFPPSSMTAAAADVNRDGIIDVYIGAHQNLLAQGGSFPSWTLNGQMDALYLGLGASGVTGDYGFWDITYDRSQYPDAFGAVTWPPAVTGFTLPPINASEYLPVFGWQAAGFDPDAFQAPCSDPLYRFSSTIAVTFTDLNRDNWPDLLVSNKGRDVSPFTGKNGPPMPWLDQTMLYINRGRDPQGNWLGFRTITWDLLLQETAPGPAGGYTASGAPMGIAVADYDGDGDMDFYLTDVSGPGDLNSLEVLNDFYVNETGTGDVHFRYSGNESFDPALQTLLLKAHGNRILPGWFSWGVLFADLDNDGDEDAYVCSKQGQDNSGLLLSAFNGEGCWDRWFENRRVQDPAVFDPQDPAFDESMQMRDWNPDPPNDPPNGEWGNTFGTALQDRRFESRNVLAGDLDQDGWVDLVVIPPKQVRPKSLQVFRNTTGTTSTASALRIHLHGGACPLAPKIPVGAKVRLDALLDGAALTSQYRELRLGESQGASAHSLALEFGIGQHPLGTALTAHVTWPCGYEEDQSFTPQSGNEDWDIQQSSHNHVGPALVIQSITAPDLSAPADGMAEQDVQVTLSPYTPDADVLQMELEMRPAGSGASWRPYRMAHGAVNGTWRLPVRPLLLEMDPADLPRGTTAWDLRVRISDRFGAAAWQEAPGALPLGAERVPATDPGWSGGGGIPPYRILQPGESMSRSYAMPGWTDSVDYAVSVQAESAGGPATLKLSCVPGTITPASRTVTTLGEYAFTIRVQATQRVDAVLTIDNASPPGGPDIRVYEVLRARLGPVPCAAH